MATRFASDELNSVPASFTNEAGRLRAFAPPFRFGSFFSPEDTLLCAIASEAALVHARIGRRKASSQGSRLHVAELTSGSGAVGFHILRIENGSRLMGLDVDPSAASLASRNARALGLGGRADFSCADIWADDIIARLRQFRPDLLICNPPYVPEPEADTMGIEAGAGVDGTSHLLRAIEIAGRVQPHALALSWCSLSDPHRIVTEAAAAGYALDSLFIVAIADGEYSGEVHGHLRTLPHAFLSEDRETLTAVAPDGSARFAYLLMAGSFSLRPRLPVGVSSVTSRLAQNFADMGMLALRNPVATVPVRTWILDRWGELKLRALLHGETAGVRLNA
jgi:hypothetical protein